MIDFNARTCLSLPQLHSELVRATIMKDFVDFYGVSKCVRLIRLPEECSLTSLFQILQCYEWK